MFLLKSLKHVILSTFSATFARLHVSQTIVGFGTLKDGSLEINSLALNNCFSYRNVFQNGVSALSKIVLIFVCLFVCFVLFFQKAQNLCSLAQTILFQFHYSMWYKIF